ncbi:MAG: response regulator transcription factor [Leptolyngbyaceae cyanobacterium bins.302]|nr:response regulator transcription factor [Leptolyngbyaceae cyanobacterium bins.302]
MPSLPLKILLVEDDELYRLGLRVRLQQEAGFELVAEAEDGETAIDLAKQHPLDIVVLDIGLPGIGGIETCRQLREQSPTLPILVLTSHTQKPLINRMIAVGAQGYCLKSAASETLILAVRSIASGASWWDPAATSEIRAAFDSGSGRGRTELNQRQPDSPLTRREQEILALIAAGHTNQEIAEMLYITPGTVRVHVHAILQKLDVRDRTQAAIVAIQKNLIDQQLLYNS